MYRLLLPSLSIVIILTSCAAPQRSGPIAARDFRPLTEIPTPREFSDSPELADVADQTGELEIHFIQVGQGDCTLVKCPNGDNILVDCGSKSPDEFSLSRTRSYLRRQLDSDEPRIDLLVVTHPDSDHYNKIPTVLSADGSQLEVQVDHIMLVGDAGDYPSGDFDDWLNSFPQEEITNVENDDYNVYPPKSLDLCGEADVTVLAANVQGTFSKKNAKSIVLLVSHGAFDSVLPGDATRETQRDILDRFGSHLYQLGGIEVLKVAHHGSRATSMLDLQSGQNEWFDVLEPQVAIFSAARNNDHGHPNVDIAQALRDHTIEAASHTLRFWNKKHELTDTSTTNGFRQEAMFLTATNKNVIVTTDGDFYEFSWDNN